MKKIIIIMMLILLIFTGCRSRTKTLLDSDCIRITQEGAKIHVYDVLGDVTYTFILKHTKPLEGDVEPIRIISNEHIVIDKYPKKLLIADLTAKKSYTISISILRVKIVFDGNFREKGGD